ncbi:protein kinase domain-containing protein [Planctomicrobium sp. SH661]|uniref:serine/threonine-protein kinase n=1 Tax=Planctomicrobium sp. SH661 TaxID=3448124 RepID=UPI003F5C7097
MKNHLIESQFVGTKSESLLSELLQHIPEGQTFDAAALISSHSELQAMPSVMVDLAYEDYWRRIQNGIQVNLDQFVDRFPEIRERLLHMIDVGDLIKQAPDVFLSLMKPQWPTVPGPLGHFELIKQIGEGAFSRVYVARDLSLAERAVTLKVTRFAVREVEALGRLQHPSIVSPLGLFDDLIPGLVVLSMPFCGRATLTDLIHARPLDRQQAKAFNYSDLLQKLNEDIEEIPEVDSVAPCLPFKQTVAWIGARLSEGLAHAHANGFCHCDIKPSNILLQRNGAPLILDFNLSVSRQQHSYTGGTLAYMAPEQLRSLGETASLDGTVDVYSLGATLIELVQGRPPFKLASQGSIKKGGMPHPLELGTPAFQFDPSIRKSLGREFASLLEQCVSLDPADRPTARELAAKLSTLSQSGLPKPVSRTRRILTRVGLATTLAAAAATTWVAVTAPSLEERYHLGLHALTRGDSPQTAFRHFSRIVEAAPARVDAKILRACSLIQLKDWDVAYGELRKIRSSVDNPEFSAILGYVLCRWDRQHELAEHEYTAAYRAGIRRLDVLNNLAFCQLRGNKLEEARKTLAEASEVGPQSPAVLYNRANVEFKLSRQLQKPPHAEVADAILANDQLSTDRESLLLASNIYWLASKVDPQYRERAIDCLKTAVECGVTRDEVSNLPDIALRQVDPRFQQVLAAAPLRRPADAAESKFDRLLSPPLQSDEYLAELSSESPGMALLSDDVPGSNSAERNGTFPGLQIRTVSNNEL